jgi:hypothetical protein
MAYTGGEVQDGIANRAGLVVISNQSKSWSVTNSVLITDTLITDYSPPTSHRER